MTLLVSGLIGGLGLVCMVFRRTFLGVMIGIQLLLLGITMAFVLAGVSSEARPEGHLFGFIIALSSIGQLVAGYALAIRRFYLTGRVHVDELRSLKQ